MRGLRVACLLLAGLAALHSPVAARGQKARLVLTIETPEQGAVVGDPGGMAFISGKALALFGKYQTFDIVFVLDTSESTAAPSGADVDRDGKTGARAGGKWLTIFGKVLPLPNTDRGDSVLAAEIAAVEILLEQLDPRSTRVGIVAFSGDHDPMTPDAYTVVPLTTEYPRVHRGLEEILDIGPNGMTNMVYGVNQGIIELLGTQSAWSEKRADARRVIIFLTDGTPTLPFDGNRTSNTRMAIERAVKAAKAGIRIDTYAIGEEALKEPVVTVEMARVTNGVFAPVRNPRDLRAIFEELDFAEIESLKIVNRTTGKKARYQHLNPDGSFAGLIPMRVGKNLLEVSARATDGSSAKATVSVRFLRDGAVQVLSPRLVAKRNRLLENQLVDLQKRRLEIQAERDAEVRRALQIEIEKERAAAEQRADEAKRRLRIDVEN